MLETKDNNESFTFIVEENISPPKKLFDKKTLREITNRYSKNIYASSFDMNDKLIDFSEHTIFEGFYQAYVNHCPIVLSPDIFWTLIIQGFTRHVLANSEALREKFVDFQGKKVLKTYNLEYPTLEDIPKEVWDKNIKTYVDDIANYVGKDLISLLKPDFSTTTPIINQVGQINIMSCMQKYFEFQLLYGGCGYPKITLEGTVEDYLKLKEKTLKLKEYDLDFWIGELIPILDKIIETRKGNIDKEFWKKMYYNAEGSIGGSGTTKKVNCIKGWLCKFAPYEKGNIKRYDDLETLQYLDPFFHLPNDLMNAPIKAINVLTQKKVDLVIRAGFIGMEQNEKTYEMKPVFGWYVSNCNNFYICKSEYRYRD